MHCLFCGRKVGMFIGFYFHEDDRSPLDSVWVVFENRPDLRPDFT